MSVDLSALQTKINELVDELQVDYRVGDKEFKNSQKMQQLLRLREQMAKIPNLGFDAVQFDNDINQNGKDNTQVVIL